MALDCTVTRHDDGLTAALTGRLTLADTAPLRTQLFKCLAEQPEALIIDLAGLLVEDPLALSVFALVGRQAARWPAIPVLLCAGGALRAQLDAGVHRRMRTFATEELARKQARLDGHSVPTVIDDLFPIAGAARQARNVVTDACLRWDLPDLVAPASVIAGELVANVIDHANTMATLRISLRPRFVTIGVRDGSTAEPRPSVPGPSGGRGLLLVESMAHTWGWLPTDGGKVVWASLSRG